MENLADHQVPRVLRPAGFGGNICVFTSASDHQALPLVPGCLAWIQIKRSHAIKIVQLTGNRKNKPAGASAETRSSTWLIFFLYLYLNSRDLKYVNTGVCDCLNVS